MNYLALYNFVRDLSLAIEPRVKFFHGRKETIVTTNPNTPYSHTPADSIPIPESWEETYIYSLPFISSGVLTENVYQVDETYSISLIFYQKDRLDSANDQNTEDDRIAPEMNILQITNDIADKFIRALNVNNFTDDLEAAADLIEIQSFTKDNAIKDTPHILTGTVLSISVKVPDNFDYCEIVT